MSGCYLRNFYRGPGQFNFPRDIVVDAIGRVYVTDTGRPNRTVSVEPTDWQAAGPNSNHRIQVFDSDGRFLNQWGSLGYQNGQFRYPYSIALTTAMAPGRLGWSPSGAWPRRTIRLRPASSSRTISNDGPVASISLVIFRAAADSALKGIVPTTPSTDTTTPSGESSTPALNWQPWQLNENSNGKSRALSGNGRSTATGGFIVVSSNRATSVMVFERIG